MDLVNYKSREEVLAQLKGFSPKNKGEAIRAIHMMSVISAAADDIKKASYDFLDNRCADCANHFDPDTGLEVVFVQNHKKVYNSSPELKNLQAQMKALKAQIDEEKKRLGYTEELGSSYWKATGK